MTIEQAKERKLELLKEVPTLLPQGKILSPSELHKTAHRMKVINEEVQQLNKIIIKHYDSLSVSSV